MIEFTGERVVPGQVEIDLWNEHISRYAFAAQFAGGKRVLDIGCGTGYGAAELSRTARRVHAVDIAPDAASYAASTYPVANLSFFAASAAALPFPDEAFDLVTAFEVIEHLKNWDQLIAEAGRVLTGDGLFVVSTPNKAYYTASRGAEGENPYHEHEFEADEFGDELRRIFPNVVLMLQNRSESFVFYPDKTYSHATARIDSSRGSATEAHFLVAICSKRRVEAVPSFVYVPRAANVLAERERHIQQLQRDLEKTQASLEDLHAAHQQQTAHLQGQNQWAIGLESDLQATQRRVVELQDSYAAEQAAAAEMARRYEEHIRELERSNDEKTRWARELTADIERLRTQLVETIAIKDAAEQTIQDRTRWALDLQQKLEQSEAKLAGVQASRWVRTGRLFGIGPEL